MKRFFAKIGRFFWSWGFLKFVLGAITLIIFFYIEEDWRGAHNWAVTKARWEAKGETFDYSKFIPPPVPDDQNLAAIPLFKLEMVKNYDGSSYFVPVSLQRAMRDDLPSFDLPSTGNWMRGELPDRSKIQKGLATGYALAFKTVKPPDDALAQFNAIYPFLADFFAAAATHPIFRINQDYTISPPASRPLGLLVQQIKFSKILTLHAILALGHHQSNLALEDIKINYEIVSGVKSDPSLVGGLVAIGVNAISGAAIYDGLAQHEWSDAQLIGLEQTLEPINFLADYQFAMRSEVVGSTANLDFFQHAHRSDVKRVFGASFSDMPWTKLLDVPWSSGWWSDNKRKMAAFLFQELATVDPRSRLVFPNVDLDLKHQVIQAAGRWDAYAPWNIWFTFGAPPMDDATRQFAAAQVWVDEAWIACGLERYRLAHGFYPGALGALVPACIDELPHDIMNGLPYHYQLRADGTYQLYSVGWNQTDDGGKVVFRKDYPKIIDYLQGDWVWPTPLLNPQK